MCNIAVWSYVMVTFCSLYRLDSFRICEAVPFQSQKNTSKCCNSKVTSCLNILHFLKYENKKKCKEWKWATMKTNLDYWKTNYKIWTAEV